MIEREKRVKIALGRAPLTINTTIFGDAVVAGSELKVRRVVSSDRERRGGGREGGRLCVMLQSLHEL